MAKKISAEERALRKELSRLRSIVRKRVERVRAVFGNYIPAVERAAHYLMPIREVEAKDLPKLHKEYMRALQSSSTKVSNLKEEYRRIFTTFNEQVPEGEEIDDYETQAFFLETLFYARYVMRDSRVVSSDVIRHIVMYAQANNIGKDELFENIETYYVLVEQALISSGTEGHSDVVKFIKKQLNKKRGRKRK